jgi:hypothetical protein
MICWPPSPTVLSWQLALLKNLLVYSLRPVSYHVSILRGILLLSAIFQTKKKNFTLSSELCTANTSANCSQSTQPNKAFYRFVGFSKNYFKHTNLKCATI